MASRKWFRALFFFSVPTARQTITQRFVIITKKKGGLDVGMLIFDRLCVVLYQDRPVRAISRDCVPRGVTFTSVDVISEWVAALMMMAACMRCCYFYFFLATSPPIFCRYLSITSPVAVFFSFFSLNKIMIFFAKAPQERKLAYREDGVLFITIE